MTSFSVRSSISFLYFASPAPFAVAPVVRFTVETGFVEAGFVVAVVDLDAAGFLVVVDFGAAVVLPAGLVPTLVGAPAFARAAAPSYSSPLNYPIILSI